METRNIIVSAKVTAEEKDKIEAAASMAYKRGEMTRPTPSTFIRTVSVAAAENVLTGGAKEDREKGKADKGTPGTGTEVQDRKRGS